MRVGAGGWRLRLELCRGMPMDLVRATDAGHQDDPANASTQGFATALAEYETTRSRNGDDNHDSGTGVKRTPIVSHEVAYPMTWKTLKKIMTDKYCQRGEIKKLEIELWNLKVKESDEVEKYVGVLPDMIHGSVMSSKPKTMQDAIKFASELMDQKIYTLAERHGRRNRTEDLNLCALNATTIMMDSVLLSAPIARGIAVENYIDLMIQNNKTRMKQKESKRIKVDIMEFYKM
ncbi:hypothetical protein Tco_0945315 [Tanacetum coccineum]